MVLLKEPKFFTKALTMGRIADIMLYPLVKGRYDNSYRVYQMLKDAKKLIDDGPAGGDPNLGIKYY